MMDNSPVLFVHGIGASGSDWERCVIPGRSAYYLSFSRPFANPTEQVPELKAEIERILAEEKKEKITLICHSMGGLTARKYLQENAGGHRVEKLVLLSTPNRGSVALSFNLAPYLMILAGILWANWVWPTLFLITGIVWEWLSFRHGIFLLSNAVWAMRPDSRFLAKLNSTALPADVKYVAGLSDTRAFPFILANLVVFWEGGDGAVPLSSQRLSERTTPNFAGLDYAEQKIDLPHFAIPKKAHLFLPLILP